MPEPNGPEGFIPPHGGFADLLSYQKSAIVFDLTHVYCDRFLRRGDRTVDQMIQAARSGKPFPPNPQLTPHPQPRLIRSSPRSPT